MCVDRFILYGARSFDRCGTCGMSSVLLYQLKRDMWRAQEKVSDDLHRCRLAETKVAALSQRCKSVVHFKVCIADDPFEDPIDHYGARDLNGYMRKFGLKSWPDTKNGEIFLQKLGLFASPPWEDENCVAVLDHLLWRASWEPSILKPSGPESRSHNWRPIDILSNNKNKAIGVNLDMLKTFSKYKANVNEANPWKGDKSPLFCCGDGKIGVLQGLGRVGSRHDGNLRWHVVGAPIVLSSSRGGPYIRKPA